jgi:methionyl-tRNA formyltransferase
MASMLVALLSAARPLPRNLQAGPVVAPHSRRVLGRCAVVRCLSMPAKAEGGGGGETRRIVFLGTPAVAARSLELLLEASRAGEGGGFEVAAVVSQPASRSGRKKTLTPSPVAQLAASEGIELLTPANAKEETFLSRLAELKPDLCVTAAYGCFLPHRFLDTPRLGTLNVHPSLLPLYRGAAPLQRCLEAGDGVAGVTVAFTVLKMDAGPVLRQEK